MRSTISLLILVAVAATGVCRAAFDPLPAADLSKLKPADFTDDELELPFYLAHFRQFADSVVAEGPERGFINIAVWRPPSGNKPYNARIMENILSLAYFYTTKRPWNIYFGSGPLRQRLEAALEFWCRVQSPEGKFSEYEPQGWNLAATAFATKFMGRALILLKSGPPMDADLLRRVEDADRKTIRVVLTADDLWKHGRSYSNQYTNVWAGGLEFFHIIPDAGLEKLFWQRVADGMGEFQSPAGFFYEADGPDFGYNSDTHQSNLQVAYVYTRGTEREEQFLEHDRRWFEWFSWNTVPEPDGSGWTVNRAVETRQRHPFYRELTSPLAEKIPTARAFAVNVDEHAAALRKRRRELEKNWPKVTPLEVGQFWAYSPYVFLHRDQFTWYPTPEQQREARAALPYHRSERLIHQMMDSRNPMIYTYVRQPAYYAAFNSGKHIREQQRYGLGLVWTPAAGALLQSQTGSNSAAWGTAAEKGAVSEAGDVMAGFEVDGKAVTPEAGIRDLPAGDLAVRYPLRAGGEKTVQFLRDRIMVRVRRSGAIIETLPLLASGQVKTGKGRVSLDGMSVGFDAAVQAAVEPTQTEVGRKHVVILQLTGSGEMTYTLSFDR